MNNKEQLELERLDIKVDIRRHNDLADILLELSNDNSVLMSAATRRKKNVIELEKELQVIEMALELMNQSLKR